MQLVQPGTWGKCLRLVQRRVLADVSDLLIELLMIVLIAIFSFMFIFFDIGVPPFLATEASSPTTLNPAVLGEGRCKCGHETIATRGSLASGASTPMPARGAGESLCGLRCTGDPYNPPYVSERA